MNSPFINMYLEIVTRIKTRMPALKYVNQDLGQLENFGDRPPVMFPALLIDFDNWNFSQIGDHEQLASGNVTMRLVYPPFSDSSSLTDAKVREKALSFYELEWELHKLLHGWTGVAFGALMRESAETEKRDDNLRVRNIVYSTCFQDSSATISNTYTTTQIPLSVDPNAIINPYEI